MSSVNFAQASTLSYCAPITPRFDKLVIDQVIRRLPVRETETQCVKRAVVTEADKPTITFIASGGTPNAEPVRFRSASPDFVPATILSKIEVAGDVKSSLSQIQDMVGVQAWLLMELIVQAVGEQMWIPAPAATAPTGMAEFAQMNPSGVINRAADPLTLADLNELRGLLSPWSPTTPLAYVMNSRLFRELEDLAMAAGTPVEYQRDERSGVVAPYWGSFPILLCDWISLTETVVDGFQTTSVYLIRIGTAADDPKGIEGVSLLVPKGGRDIRVSALQPDSSTGADLWVANVYWSVALDAGSRGAAIGRMRAVRSPIP